MKKLRKGLSQFKQRLLSRPYKGLVSYSQTGEDLIVFNLFNHLGISQPTYFDIGANDPIQYSNSYFFYLRGSKGVCVEPNPVLVEKFRSKRPKDTILEVGISIDGRVSADYYMMSWHEFNTFSKERAVEIQNHYGGKNNIERVVERELISVMDVFDKHIGISPNFLSLDVEGLDFEILKQIDFSRMSPDVFCVETLSLSEPGLKSSTELFFLERGYSLFAHTYVNSLFVKNTIIESL